MPFVRINNYFVNLDAIAYVEENGKELFVHFTDASGVQMTLSVQTTSSQGSNLVRALNQHSH